MKFLLSISRTWSQVAMAISSLWANAEYWNFSHSFPFPRYSFRISNLLKVIVGHMRSLTVIRQQLMVETRCKLGKYLIVFVSPGRLTYIQHDSFGSTRVIISLGHIVICGSRHRDYPRSRFYGLRITGPGSRDGFPKFWILSCRKGDFYNAVSCCA